MWGTGASSSHEFTAQTVTAQTTTPLRMFIHKLEGPARARLLASLKTKHDEMSRTIGLMGKAVLLGKGYVPLSNETNFTHLDSVELCAHGAAVGAIEGAHEVGHGGAVGHTHSQVCGEGVSGAEAVSGGLKLRRIRARGTEKSILEVCNSFMNS